MNVRRDSELKTFNIAETAIDYGDFGSWTKYTFIVLWLDMAPIDSFMCLNKPMGPGSGMSWFEYAWPRE